MLTQNRVKELFKYSEGKLIRISISSSKFKNGSIAGCYCSSSKYYRVKIDGKKYLLHRVVFLYHHGFLPKTIDHIDGNKLNNKIENLRSCTQHQNCFNSKIPKTNKSGFKGVYWDKDAKLWAAEININGKSTRFGRFWEKETAAQVVRIERIRIHGEFANHG